jgi:allantoate deiminase
VRHPRDNVRSAAVQHYLAYAQSAAAARGVSVVSSTSIDQAAVPMCSDLSALLGAAVSRSTGREPRFMISGAGHDAMIVARRVPATILFLRSPGGLSHHPDEAVVPGDVEAALATGVEFLRSLRDDKTTLERVSASTSARKREDIHA